MAWVERMDEITFMLSSDVEPDSFGSVDPDQDPER